MLAFIPTSHPLHDHHASQSMMDSGTSATRLSMNYGQACLPANLPTSPSPSKRPKLSLNTSNTSPIFGKDDTSLRLETLSATSPTIRNTFQNGQTKGTCFGANFKQSTSTPSTANIGASLTDSPSQTSPQSSCDTVGLSHPPTASAMSISSGPSSPLDAPSKLPFNAISILANGPIHRSKSRRFSLAQSQPIFPVPKKVGFRTPLTEDIKTSKYTMRHSDIEPSMSELELSSSIADEERVGGIAKSNVRDSITMPSATCLKREVDDIVDRDDKTGRHFTTPTTGRAKRHRWVWTLPSIEKALPESAITMTSSPDATL